MELEADSCSDVVFPPLPIRDAADEETVFYRVVWLNITKIVLILAGFLAGGEGRATRWTTRVRRRILLAGEHGHSYQNRGKFDVGTQVGPRVMKRWVNTCTPRGAVLETREGAGAGKPEG